MKDAPTSLDMHKGLLYVGSFAAIQVFDTFTGAHVRTMRGGWRAPEMVRFVDDRIYMVERNERHDPNPKWTTRKLLSDGEERLQWMESFTPADRVATAGWFWGRAVTRTT